MVFQQIINILKNILHQNHLKTPTDLEAIDKIFTFVLQPTPPKQVK